MTTYTATYSPDDNKLRLTASSRLDAETYARVKAAGFSWAPKQEQFIAPMWTPERADLCIELAGDIEDDDSNIAERAAERAERFDGYESNRRADADAAHRDVHRITEGIPLGQPILVGHHSERHARKDAERIENGMRRAVRAWDTAEYWKRRASAALAHADFKERPDVRHRRIKGLESDQRKHQKNHDGAQKFLSLWDTVLTSEAGWKPRTDGQPGDPRTRCLTLAGMSGGGACDYGLWSKLDKNEITLEEAREEAMASCRRRIAWDARWLEHIGFRLDYERAMLGEAGGIAADAFDLQIGGVVVHRGRRSVIKRINKVGGKVSSVTVVGQGWTVGIEEITAYEPPTEQSAEAVKTINKLPPLVNHETPNCARMTQADWARIHTDHKTTRVIKATDTHAAHRMRAVMGHLGARYGAPRGEAWGYSLVFITDAKVTPAPDLNAAPRKSMARKIAEATGADVSGVAEDAAPTRVEQVKAAREVIMEASAPTLPDVLRETSRLKASNVQHAAQKSESADFEAMRSALRTGVQVVSAPQLFPTPPTLATRMVEMAGVQSGARILEPSAGTGRILDALRTAGAMHSCVIRGVEVNRHMADRLAANYPGVIVDCRDFLTMDRTHCDPFDVILMNPPFAAGADVEHVTHAAQFLAPGGRLVAIMSAGVNFREDKRTREFRALVERMGGYIEALPAGTFESSGTGVNVVFVVLDSPTAAAGAAVTQTGACA